MHTDVDRVTDKLRKLLRLADQKDSAEEAAVAYAHAQRLATMHGLNLDEVALDGAETEADIPLVVETIRQEVLDEWGKLVAWRTTLAHVVAEANNCKTFRRHYNSGGAAVIVYGQPADIHVVHVLYRSIGEQIDRLAKDAVKRRSGIGYTEGNRTYGRSFRLGAVSEIRRRLPRPADVVAEHRNDVDERRREAIVEGDAQSLASSTTALARVCAAEQHLTAVRKAVDSYEETLNLKTGRNFASADASGYYAGRRAARSVNINRPAKGMKH